MFHTSDTSLDQFIVLIQRGKATISVDHWPSPQTGGTPISGPAQWRFKACIVHTGCTSASRRKAVLQATSGHSSALSPYGWFAYLDAIGARRASRLAPGLKDYYQYTWQPQRMQ